MPRYSRPLTRTGAVESAGTIRASATVPVPTPAPLANAMPPVTGVARQTSPAGMSSTRAPSGCVTVSVASPPSATDPAPTMRPICTAGSPVAGPGPGVETWAGGLAQPKTTAATAAHASLRRSTAEIAKLELDPEVLASERRDDGL